MTSETLERHATNGMSPTTEHWRIVLRERQVADTLMWPKIETYRTLGQVCFLQTRRIWLTSPVCRSKEPRSSDTTSSPNGAAVVWVASLQVVLSRHKRVGKLWPKQKTKTLEFFARKTRISLHTMKLQKKRVSVHRQTLPKLSCEGRRDVSSCWFWSPALPVVIQ